MKLRPICRRQSLSNKQQPKTNIVAYPGSLPEFRVLVKVDGSQAFQVRYVNSVQGYTGGWQDIPLAFEDDKSNPRAVVVNVFAEGKY